MSLLYAELGSFVNLITIIVGACIGLLFRKGISSKVLETLTKGMYFCVVFIGISGLSKGENALITILSMGIGAVIGELIDIDKQMNRFGAFLEAKGKKLSLGADGKLAEGFVSCTLVFCIGAMAITGAFNSALGDHTILFSKSVIDGVTACMLATTLGVGCALSAVPVFLYQGILTLIFYFVGAALPASTIGEITCVGSILIMIIGFNLLGMTKVKVANLIPAMFMPLLLCLIPWENFM